ncbi:MAG: ribosome small subunit-dependent GTPase A [Paludibacteraceae bacterium]|nr:ribosome small subunit-dependent GTPase A [Paludibacteraceae bacterium]
MRGLVIKSTGNAYLVRMDDGSDVECHIKGNFRIRGIRSTNPVAVGDYVEVQTLADGTNWITEIEERRNYIIRRSTNLSKESHILAANIDQVALIVTVNHPETSTTFIDRFLATCEAYSVPTVLIFNKIDLFTPDEIARVEELRSLYESIGYTTLAISAVSGELSDLKKQFVNKVTLLSGNSGVGKSTLLNALFGKEMTRTGKISDAHDKGMHTTTFSEMYFLDDITPGAVIDTPGIKGFGAINMEKEEVSHYFREIFRTAQECRFGNCTHTGEPGCAVSEAVVRGEIAMSRYESYLSILGDCTETKYR